jgi:hypothetical protein
MKSPTHVYITQMASKYPQSRSALGGPHPLHPISTTRGEINALWAPFDGPDWVTVAPVSHDVGVGVKRPKPHSGVLTRREEVTWWTRRSGNRVKRKRIYRAAMANEFSSRTSLFFPKSVQFTCCKRQGRTSISLTRSSMTKP